MKNNIDEIDKQKHKIRSEWFSVFLYPTILLGIILIFFGDNILLVITEIKAFQFIGIIFITIGFFSYTYVNYQSPYEKRPLIKRYYLIVNSLLIITLFYYLWVMLICIIIKDNDVISFHPFIASVLFIIYYVIFSDLVTKAVSFLLKNFKTIDPGAQRITITIALFGALISILTLINK